MSGGPVDGPVVTGAQARRLLYRRDRAAARHRAVLARSFGLTDSELAALIHLAHEGQLAPSRLGALLGLSSGGVTALVQRLERAGHLTRAPHPEDRRSVLIGLTERTAARLEAAEAPVLGGIDRLLGQLSGPQQTAILEFLSRLAELTESLDESVRRRVRPPAEAPSRPVPSLWG